MHSSRDKDARPSPILLSLVSVTPSAVEQSPPPPILTSKSSILAPNQSDWHSAQLPRFFHMASGVLQDSMHPSPSAHAPKFSPYASPNHQVSKGRYITSNDPRGYIPVYEYPVNGHWIMMDVDDGYILWTGIWKALGHSKADVVRMIDSQPDLAPLIRRVRGGYLKIQGTWMPFEVALKLSRRVAWKIRNDLIPLFGPTFPSTCLSPDQPGYGQLIPAANGRRRNRRLTQVMPSHMSVQQPPQANWTVVTPASGLDDFHKTRRKSLPDDRQPSTSSRPLGSPSDTSEQSYQRFPPSTHPFGVTLTPSSPSPSPSVNRSQISRYSPYPDRSTLGRRSSTASLTSQLPALSLQDHVPDSRGRLGDIVLPRIQSSPHVETQGTSGFTLPPISAMEDMRGIRSNDSAAVLRRLQLDDSDREHMNSRSSSFSGSASHSHRLSSSSGESSGSHLRSVDDHASDLERDTTHLSQNGYSNRGPPPSSPPRPYYPGAEGLRLHTTPTIKDNALMGSRSDASATPRPDTWMNTRQYHGPDETLRERGMRISACRDSQERRGGGESPVYSYRRW